MSYQIYRDHGNNLLVIDGACNIVYPAPTVARGSCVLVHRVTTDLNNPPSPENPWLCETLDGTVVLFTSADSHPVWQSCTNYTYVPWSKYSWAPHGDVLPAIDVKVGDKWETLNGKVGVITRLSYGECRIAFHDAEQRSKLTALKRKVEAAAPAYDDVYLRAEFERRHPGLFLVREGTGYADNLVHGRWVTWINAIDTVRAATGKSDEHKALEHKCADLTADLINERDQARIKDARIKDLLDKARTKDERIKELESEETKWRAINQSNNEIRAGHCNWLAEIADALDVPSGHIGFIRGGLKAWKGRIKELEQARDSLLEENQKLRNAAAAVQDFSGLEARVMAFCVSGDSTDRITSIPTGRITGAQPTLAAPYGSNPFALAHASARIKELEAKAEKDQNTISSLRGQVESKSKRIEQHKKLPAYRLAQGMSELLDVPLTSAAKDDIKAMLDKVKGLQAQLAQAYRRNDTVNVASTNAQRRIEEALGLLRGTRG